MIWTRFVAIGDSFTEGMSDPDPLRENAFVGWADRLAGHLAERAYAVGSPFEYANLAVRGRKVDDVIGPQLEAALAMHPDLVSMVGGGNDILRPSVDLDSVAERLESAVLRLREAGIHVLLATPADTRDAGLFKTLRGRHGVHAANVFTIAERHGCSVLNLWGLAAIRDWRMWSEDRIHLSTEGHRRVAQAALEALGLDPSEPGWRDPLPAPSRATRQEELREHLAWVRTHAAPWVERRLRGTSSGDSVRAKRPTPTPWQPA